MSWYLKGDLIFRVFHKKGHQLKYVGKEITHTPVTFCTITSGVFNRLTKITLQTSETDPKMADAV